MCDCARTVAGKEADRRVEQGVSPSCAAILDRYAELLHMEKYRSTVGAMDDLLSASALEQAAAIRVGDVSSRELVEASLAKAEQVQVELNAFTVLDPDRALAAADSIRPGDPRPFAGVPYAVKDLAIACAGLPLTNGSRLFGDFTPTPDSVAVERARAAGLVVVGKTVSAELGAMVVTEPSLFGAVRNPYDRERTAGGSSGGAAAADAGGAIAIASASDAGGSIRIPAACCGLVGLKPARGRISLGPELGEHPIAVEGCVARTVADSAAFLDAVAGPSPGDATWAPPPARPFAHALTDTTRLRIGVCTRPPFDTTVDAARLEAVARAADALSDLGHDVVEIDGNPWGAADVLPLFIDVFAIGTAAFASVGELVTGQVAGEETLDPLTWQLVQRGRELPGIALAGAQNVLGAWSRSVIVALADYAAILSPVLAGPPLPIGTFAEPSPTIMETLARAFGWAPFPVVANITGLPALALPYGVDAEGLPLSVHLLGRQADEATLISLGSQLGA
jgi:amidase